MRVRDHNQLIHASVTDFRLDTNCYVVTNTWSWIFSTTINSHYPKYLCKANREIKNWKSDGFVIAVKFSPHPKMKKILFPVISFINATKQKNLSNETLSTLHKGYVEYNSKSLASFSFYFLFHGIITKISYIPHTVALLFSFNFPLASPA